MKAKALYDNSSDDVEELSFLKNDVMEVLEQDYDGMEGWWLCKLNAKTGIVPGNRLMIITVMDDSCKDYDTPKALLDDRRSRADDYDTPVSKSHLNTPSESSSDQRSSNHSNKSTESAKAHSNPLSECSFSRLFSTFKKSHKDTEVLAKQMVQMIDRWNNCQNSSNLQTVIKTMCVNLWKRLQDYLAESSKMFVSLKVLAAPEVGESLKEIKRVSRGIEDVLEGLNRTALDQTRFHETLNQMKKLLKQLLENMTLFGNFYDNVDKEKSWLKVIDEQESNPKTQKYQSTLSFCSMDYDLPRNSKVNELAGLSKDSSQQYPNRVQSTDLSKQMNKLRIEQLNKSSDFSEYDRPKSVENLDEATSATTTDYDMPRNSIDEISIKQDFSYRPKSLDTLDYDSPSSSRLMPNKLVKSMNTSSEQGRATSDYIANPDYDIPPPESTRKSMEQLLTLTNQQGFKEKFNPHSNLPQKSLKHESRVESSLEPSDYDYPSASASQIDITDVIDNNTKPTQFAVSNIVNNITSNNNETYDWHQNSLAGRQEIKSKQQTLPNFDKFEANLLKYYKPHLLSQLELVSEHIQLVTNQLEVSKQDPKDLTQKIKFLAISSHKFVFIIDFITKQLSKHKLFCRELNLTCNKIVDYLKCLVSLTKQCNEANSKIPLKDKMMNSLSDLKATLKGAGNLITLWQC